MKQTMKVANWEVKRNIKNKSFIIGLFITPLLFVAFLIIPSFFSGDDEPETIHIYVQDDVNIINVIRASIEQVDFIDWRIEETTASHDEMLEQLADGENMVYFKLTEEAFALGEFTFYTSEEIDSQFMNQTHIIEESLRQLHLQQLGLSEEVLTQISKGVSFNVETISDDSFTETDSDSAVVEDPLERLVPGIFAGIILFSIIISGMMIFQSASQEKKDKIAEIILSSVTPTELMQGKIIGYFMLGLIQLIAWFVVAAPVILWKANFPILEYLFVPELLILLLFAILGYLLFASIFVGIGATIEDISTSGNFQGIVMMLPFLPLIFLGPILSDPQGIIAKVGSYVPFTSPGVMLIRLSMLDDWPWIEIIISIAILIISIWVFMKLAGKIFQTGILMYGKNATPKEIWRWLRA